MQSSCATWLRVASTVALLTFPLLDVIAQAQSASPYSYQIDIVGGSIAQQGTVLPITLYNQWLSGVPALTTCATRFRRNAPMIAGPTRNVRRRAVTAAPAARKLM